MGTLGFIRRIDDLERIAIPKELRRELRVKDGDSFEISTMDGWRYRPHLISLV